MALLIAIGCLLTAWVFLSVLGGERESQVQSLKLAIQAEMQAAEAARKKEGKVRAPAPVEV